MKTRIIMRRAFGFGTAVAVAAAVAAIGASASAHRTAVPSTLKRFTSLTLAGTGGTIQAVVYDGNHALAFRDSTATTGLTGFTAPSRPFTAKTTFVVVDGQCGSNTPNGCNGVHSIGGWDTLSFTGGSGKLSDGPDAFKGSDPCPWGRDTCLWDTRTFDVSGYVAPGDMSVTATVTTGEDPSNISDCVNHEAQIFAVGPAAAWTNAGYVAAGVGLRNQGSGNVRIGGIPAGSPVAKAFLYWNVLNASEPSAGITLQGTGIRGTMIGQDEAPCWGPVRSWAYRADVTSLVTGNGTYAISGYPTGTTSGTAPWPGPPVAPMMDGASLIVFYGRATQPSSSAHRRTLTLRVRASRATGALRVLDGYEPCRVGALVFVERRQKQRWSIVRRARTDRAGVFSVSIPRGRATYRARAPEGTAEGQKCLKAVSRTVATSG
jgi:hypothetical protein